MTDRKKWNGGFEAFRRIAVDLVGDHSDNPDMLIEKIAETLVEVFDDGVYTEGCARDANMLEETDPEIKRLLFTRLLHERGIGIATLDEMEAYTRAVVRGELKPAPDDPKLWFTSIDSVIESLKTIGGDHDDGDVELYEECVRTERPMREKE